MPFDSRRSLRERPLNRDAAGDTYALGYSAAEHDRLVRQAHRLAPFTSLLFRQAGLEKGQRVLDVGSGVGDVAMLVANLVGPSGAVVGVERHGGSVHRARARAAEAGLLNVSFIEADASQLPSGELFDAVVGRFVLQFIPDPASALRSLSRLVRPAGVIAFQEIAWTPCLQMNQHLPLWSACAAITRDAIRDAGAQTDSGLSLYGTFGDAGLPTPTVRIDFNASASPEFTNWTYELLRSVKIFDEADPTLARLGDFATLPERIHAEVVASRGVLISPAYVGAHCRMTSTS